LRNFRQMVDEGGSSSDGRREGFHHFSPMRRGAMVLQAITKPFWHVLCYWPNALRHVKKAAP
jgi:hypothetical protein